MDYQLQKLVQLLQKECSPAAFSKQKKGETLMAIILDIFTNTELHLYHLIDSDRPKVTSHFVPLYQSDLIISMDILYHHLLIIDQNPSPAFAELKKIYIDVLERLKTTLNFINRYFPEEGNAQQPIPEYYREEKIVFANRFTKWLERKLSTFNILPILVQAVCTPILHFCDLDKSITYYRLNYISDFYKRLLLKIECYPLDNEQILSFLIEAGFNEVFFQQHYLDSVRLQVSEMASSAEQLSFFYYQRKILRQAMIFSSGLRSNCFLPQSAQSFEVFVENEIAYLELQYNYEAKVSRSVSSTETRDKIKLSLSVEELGLSIRLLMEAKIIVNTNISEVARFVSRHFSSIKKTDIATDSLTRKTSGFELRLVNRVRDKVMNVFNIARTFLPGHLN